MKKIRRATSEDVSEIISIVQAAYKPYFERIGRPPAPMETDYAEILNRYEVWVSELDGGVAGLLVLIPMSDHLLLDNIAVRTDLQGSGIGAALLNHAESRARDLGLSEIRLYTNEKMFENLLYYPRHGYVRTRSAIEEGFNRVYFSRFLP